MIYWNHVACGRLNFLWKIVVKKFGKWELQKKLRQNIGCLWFDVLSILKMKSCIWTKLWFQKLLLGRYDGHCCRWWSLNSANRPLPCCYHPAQPTMALADGILVVYCSPLIEPGSKAIQRSSRSGCWKLRRCDCPALAHWACPPCPLRAACWWVHYFYCPPPPLCWQ